MLHSHGYRVIGAQVEGGYELTVDGEPRWIPLRADFLVARDEYTYVAEVKSGRLAPRLQTAATRRQLLEYLMSYDVDGVLLVDPEKQRIQEVVFPNVMRREVREAGGGLAPLLLGVAALACVVALLLLR
ncbi:MAG: hypothetical protein QM784_16145 [Polyangiaceae bacterium]